MECIANKRGSDKNGNVIYSTLSGSEYFLFQADIMEIVAVKTSNLLVASVYTPPASSERDRKSNPTSAVDSL